MGVDAAPITVDEVNVTQVPSANSTISMFWSNINTLIVNEGYVAGEGAVTEVSQRSSISHMRGPITNLVQTETMNEVTETINNQNAVVLHLIGMPGSGKTQLVRYISEEFPFNHRESLLIKWAVQCKDSEHDVKTQLQKLADKLHAHGFIPKELSDTMKDELDMNGVESLVNALLDSQASVLIVVEDQEKPNLVLRDFVRNLITAPYHGASKVHLYVTSKKINSLFSNDEFQDILKSFDGDASALKCTRKFVNGFN